MTKYLPVLITLLLAGLLIWGPWEIPYGFRTAARVQPAEAWELIHRPNGSLTASWYDHRLGGMRDQQTYQFDEEDIWDVRYQIDSSEVNWLDAGDEVLRITSNSLQQQLLDVENQIRNLQALLIRDEAGEKPETITRLEEEIRLAEQSLSLLQKQYDRAAEMVAEGLSAVAEFERAENALREGQVQLQLAEKRLEEFIAGQKPEQLDWLRTQILTLQQTAAFLRAKDSLYIIGTPVSGTWSSFRDIDGTEHFIVEDTTAAVLSLPVRERDIHYLQDTFLIILDRGGGDLEFEASNWSFTGQRSVVDNEQVRWVQIRVPGLRSSWSTEIPLPCRIESGRVDLWTYLKQNVRLKW